MNRRQYEYAVKLAEVRSFSGLAEELHISQPALSKQIGALEQELGVRLFDRSTSPLSLTPAGAHFIEEVKGLVYKEDQLLRTMDKFRSGEAGRLTVGVSPFRCVSLMPRIVKAIRQAFPQVEVVLHEDDSIELRRDAAEGKFDFAILNLPVDESVLDAVPITEESVVLAVPEAMVEPLPVNDGAVAFGDCGKLPFVVVGKGQEMRELFDKMCAAADIQPVIAAQVKSLTAACEMAAAGVGATVLPLSLLEDTLTDKAVRLFTLTDVADTRRPAVVTRRGQYLSEYAKFAIDLLTQ